MAVKTNHKVMLKKLTEQVRILEKNEEAAKNQLRNALKKIRKLSLTYKSKLASKMRVMKNKIADAQASTYANAALHFERQLQKGIDSKGKALVSALSKIEKKHVAKLQKSIGKKAKPAKKMKKVSKASASVNPRKKRGTKK